MSKRKSLHESMLHQSNSISVLVVLVGLFAASGANCQQWTRQYTQPRTLPVSATQDQIVMVVNDNSNRVRSLQSTQATLSIAGAPTSLRASVALEPPCRLRLRADAPFSGSELDLGSNDELFWLWLKRSQPPAMFVCRHDQFAMSNARQIMPVEPDWLVEAVGLPRFDASQQLEGPNPVGGGRLQIRSRQLSALGEMTKVTIIDEWDGAVVEQHLYDPQGRLLATARTSRYKRDPASGAALPRSIDVQWPTTQPPLSFHLDVTDWLVNTIAPENLALFAKPDYPGYPEMNLADPNLRFVSPGSSALMPPVAPVMMPMPAAASPIVVTPTATGQSLPKR
jgi:hypothetical protein